MHCESAECFINNLVAYFIVRGAGGNPRPSRARSLHPSDRVRLRAAEGRAFEVYHHGRPIYFQDVPAAGAMIYFGVPSYGVHVNGTVDARPSQPVVQQTLGDVDRDALDVQGDLPGAA